jgi:ATP-dependent Clp endopeptidase proteolytic subunit ClpP
MTPGRPYTIAMVGLNDAEINLYGEVVQSRPVDWWTGQPMGGNFICVDEFLRDLEELSTKDNITVHINSVGGDFYAGLAIYNRLRNLSANITTINDGLAASAGSIIFMAGDKRKMHAGSNLMVHGVLGFFYGYYNVGDLRTAIKELEAHNKAAVAAYVEATGLDADIVKAAMSKDTYMVGQEAVDLGWADEVITDDEGEEPVNMKLAPDRATMMVNGYRVAARCIGKIPDGVPVMTDEEWAEVSAPVNRAMPAEQDSNNIIQNGGKEEMEQFSNLDELRAAYPDLLAEAETAAQAKGCADERARIKGIEAIEKAVGDTALVNSAKYGEKPMTAEQLAFAAMQAQAAIGATVLQQMEQDNEGSGVDGVEATPAAPETPAPSEDEQAMALLTAAANNMKEVK